MSQAKFITSVITIYQLPLVFMDNNLSKDIFYEYYLLRDNMDKEQVLIHLLTFTKFCIYLIFHVKCLLIFEDQEISINFRSSYYIFLITLFILLFTLHKQCFLFVCLFFLLVSNAT